MARKVATNRAVERADLIEFIRPRHRMILATARADGSSQLSPVTGGVDGDGRITISTYPDRAKTTNARRNSAVSVLVLSDEWNEAWVQVRGTAEVLDMPASEEALIEYFRCVSGEHPDWDDYRNAMRLQNKSVIRIRLEHWGPIATGGFPADVAERLDAAGP
jgi:PPOX class probable F420-dependent enzyme